MGPVGHRAGSARSVAILAALLLAAGARADDVHMKNGQTFENVIAVEEGAGVRIRVAFGDITVPRSSVARIVRGESSVDRYLSRRAELESAGAGAAEWLALAGWARREGVDHGAREAAVRAARLEPRLEGLAPLLRSLGYTFSEERGEWLSGDDYMRSIGYVRSGGEWVSPAEIAERERLARLAAEERREARAAARDERIAQAVEMLALQELAEQTQPEPVPTVGLPIAVFPGYYPPPAFVAPRHSSVFVSPYGPTAERKDPPYALDILDRMPGSLFPIRSHRGGVKPAAPN